MSGEELLQAAERAFQVGLPEELVGFWNTIGSGYFGGRLLYVFGDGRQPLPRTSLIEWNQEDFWREIYPSVKDGGPLFFSETCFGEQIGVRQEGGAWIPILVIVDTFEAFRLAPDVRTLFDEVLIATDSIDDPERVAQVTMKLGPLPAGMHYAPIVSPLVGGGDEAANFHLETPSMHLRTTLATFRAVGGRSRDPAQE